VKKAFAAAAIAATLLANAPLGFIQPAHAATPAAYKIGVTYPRTGPLAGAADSALNGAKLAVEDINRRGGVKGHPLELVIEDSQGTPQGGVAAMRKVVQSDGVQAVLTIFTNVVAAQIPLADELKIPTLSTVEAPNLFTKSEYSFAHASTLTQVAPHLRDYWKAGGYKRVFAFFGNNAYGKAYAPGVKVVAQQAGAEYDEAFLDMTASDYRGVIARAKQFNPDAILVGAQGSTAESTVIRQLREMGLTAKLFNASNFYYDKPWRNAVGSYAEGMIYAGLNVDESVPSGKAFAAAYRAKENLDPGYQAAEAYDIIHMFAHAIEKSQYKGEAIRGVLSSLRGLPSVFGGTINMAADNYTIETAVGLWEVTANDKLRRAPLPRRK
jgi:branched-chain amino acid transport system substrate-binding protein